MSTTLPKYLPLLSVYLPASPYPSFLPLPIILILFSYPLLKPQNLTGLRTVTDSNKGSMIFEKKLIQLFCFFVKKIEQHH